MSRQDTARAAALGLAALAVAAAHAPATAAQAASPDRPAQATLRAAPDMPARLVLDDAPDGGWRVSQSGRRAEIRFPAHAVDIDLSGLSLPALGGTVVDARAARDARTTFLRLELGCDCRLAVHGGEDGRLAIDVVGAATGRGVARLAVSPAPDRAPSPGARPAPQPSPSSPAAAEGTDRPAGPGARPPASPRGSLDPRIAAARARLVKQLERAAEAGLIELAPPEATGPAADPDPAKEEAVASGAADGAEPSSGRDRAAARAIHHPPLRAGESRAPVARTPYVAGPEQAAPAEAPADPDPPAGHDRPPRSGPAPARVGADAAALPNLARETPVSAADAPERDLAAAPRGRLRCQPDEALALPDGTPEGGAAARLAELGRVLLGEFDRIDRQAALALARFYLSRGLGAEAELALERLAPGARETPALAALARIIEGRALPPRHALAARGCPGMHASWHALAAARAGRPERAIARPDAAAAGLAGLPRLLRREAAAILGLAAADAQDWPLARRFEALARRATLGRDAAEPRLTLLAARIARATGEAQRARTLLGRAAAGGGPAAPEALVLLGEMTADVPGPAAGDSLNLRLELAAAGRLLAGTRLGFRAVAAEARLLGRAAGREAALDLAARARAEGRLDPAGYRALARRLAALPEPGENSPPLAVVFERAPERHAPALEEPAFRTALARSYAEIGLPSRADSILRPGDLGDPRLAGALARARLAAGDHAGASEAARHLPEGDRRSALLARIALAVDDPARAVAALGPHGAERAPRLAARAAWAAGEWELAAEALARQHAEAPAPETAARLAVARERAGATATRSRGDEDGSGQAGFPGARSPQFEPTPQGVARYLAALRQETAAIAEVLADG